MSDSKRRVIVRYRLKPERVAENEELVRTVFAALAKAAPAGLAYATYKMPDGVSFMHVAEVDMAAAGGKHPLTSQPAFEAFTREIAARCDEPPVTATVELVGSYRAT